MIDFMDKLSPEARALATEASAEFKSHLVFEIYMVGYGDALEKGVEIGARSYRTQPETKSEAA